MLEPLLRWLQTFFYTKKLDVCIIGLPGAGKTTLASVLASGHVPEHVSPTVGYHLRQVRFGNAHIRLWDLAYVSRLNSEVSRVSVPCGSVIALVFLQSSLPWTLAYLCRWTSRKLRKGPRMESRAQTNVILAHGLLLQRSFIRCFSNPHSRVCHFLCWQPRATSQVMPVSERSSTPCTLPL